MGTGEFAQALSETNVSTEDLQNRNTVKAIERPGKSVPLNPFKMWKTMRKIMTSIQDFMTLINIFAHQPSISSVTPIIPEHSQKNIRNWQKLGKYWKRNKKHINEHTLSNHFYHPMTGYGEVLALYRQVRAKGHPISLSRIKKMAKRTRDVYSS